MTRTLVAYATRHGSTREIAELIGEELRAFGSDTDVRPAREVTDVGPYDVVVVGSAVYMNQWEKDARQLLRRFEGALRARRTWLFSSGPIGGPEEANAKIAEIIRTQAAPPGEAGRLAARIRAQGHATFGGQVTEEMTGFFERWLPRGDWRDLPAVAAWARGIIRAAQDPTDWRRQRPQRSLQGA